MIKNVSDYEFKLRWSVDDGEWVGTCLLFPSLFHFDTDPREAIAGIMDLVDGCLHDMTENVGAHP